MPLMLNREIGARRLEMHAVGSVHPLLQGDHGAGHFGIIHGADPEIKILERLRAHVGGLGHAGRGPAQDAPAGFVDTPILHRPDGLVVEASRSAGHVGVFARVVGAADGDVGLHAFHAGQLDIAHQPGVGGGGLERQFAAEAGMARLDEREGAPAPGGPHQLDGELVGHVEHSSRMRSPFFRAVE